MDQLQQRQAELLNHRQKSNTLERDRSALRQQITERRNELSGLSSRHENQLAIVHRMLSEIDREFIESEARRILVIKAPQTGVVTAIFAESGQTTGITRPLLGIVPNNSLLQANLYSSSKSIGFIRVGDKLRIRYQTCPYQEFGQHNDTVKSISKASISAGGACKRGRRNTRHWLGQRTLLSNTRRSGPTACSSVWRTTAIANGHVT
ncbi:HlyD family efflux transporter periplasmic adaptor subunit [Pseudomonas sp. NFACC05-1]|uniref:HlyD family efflux transporter periplasmic adaptor subunit n=1 Tax=Pseudomonas sp. NFACC05-1 TaxID=1566241 RepID=UPI0008717AE6|nr:HlyD family efflux transporter periplasmic adaptor subunit [Pseudomonas sp. NFACC05-1]SCW57656.1 HlyD family secretion protein [Pseudomonas sp. NFACC05-1]